MLTARAWRRAPLSNAPFTYSRNTAKISIDYESINQLSSQLPETFLVDKLEPMARTRRLTEEEGGTRRPAGLSQ
jgi:hypothetical protein